MVTPSDGDGKNSALDGLVEQILSYHGIKNAIYNSVLNRGENSLDCTLKLASELSLQSVQFDVQKANGDSGCGLLTSLPPYPC
jgi:zearalenone synthase (highly reducing iterative type I polyketide synthase)